MSVEFKPASPQKVERIVRHLGIEVGEVRELANKSTSDDHALAARCAA
jgi:hypothetical protein